MRYYNCHTHIFASQYVPNNVVGVPIMNFLAKYPVSRKLVKFFGRLRFGAVDSQLERVAKFAAIGLGTSQETIFNHLEDYYQGWGDVRFVILPMDMEQMGAGLPLSNYRTQLEELIRLRAKGHYANNLLPFICVDPRRPEFTNGIVLRDWVRNYFENYGFVGIKMYPALGYYPFDEKLDELYQWASDRKVPITYHCIDGVIHYRGSLNGFPAPRFKSQYHKLDEKDPAKYQWNFTEPDNYNLLLQKFGDLKINLAHYSGDDKITTNHRWYQTVRGLVAGKNNVFADVSFSLNNTSIFRTIHADINDQNSPELGKKILFGTDYYVVEKNKDEAFLRDELRSALNKLDTEHKITVSSFDRIAGENAERFLRSEYYST